MAIGKRVNKRSSTPKTSQSRSEAEHSTNENKQHEWVSVEEYDSDGRLIMPRDLVRSTARTMYDPEKHNDLDLRILTGYAPQGALLGQYKLYDVKKLSMKGWRLKAEATIELEPTRGYEKDWFKAFEGSNMIVVDPGTSRDVSNEFKMKVTQSDFSKKVASFIDQKGNKKKKQMYEGHLSMREKISSALFRRKIEFCKYVMVTVIAAIIAALMNNLF